MAYFVAAGKILDSHETVLCKLNLIYDKAIPYLQMNDPDKIINKAKDDGIDLHYLALVAYSLFRHDLLDRLLENYVDINYNYIDLISRISPIEIKYPDPIITSDYFHIKVLLSSKGYNLGFDSDDYLAIFDLRCHEDISDEMYEVLKKHMKKFVKFDDIEVLYHCDNGKVFKLLLESGFRPDIHWIIACMFFHDNSIIDTLMNCDWFDINIKYGENYTILYSYLMNKADDMDMKFLMKLLSLGAKMYRSKLSNVIYKIAILNKGCEYKTRNMLYEIVNILMENKVISRRDLIRVCKNNDCLRYLRDMLIDEDSNIISEAFTRFIKVRRNRRNMRRFINSLVMFRNILDRDIMENFFEYTFFKGV